MAMNKNTALKILGLGPGASLDQAKKAFRDLAKRYHPDRYSKQVYPDDEIGSAQADARMTRMKQINQAFDFLSPLLVPNKLSPSNGGGEKASDSPFSQKNTPPKRSQAKTNPDFRDFWELLKRKLNLRRYRQSFVPKGRPVKPLVPSGGNREKRLLKKEGFASILNTLHPGFASYKMKQNHGRSSGVQSPHPKVTKGAHPYGNFLKYMDLKKKIDARARSCGGQTVHKIERIRPVTRVNPKGDKNES